MTARHLKEVVRLASGTGPLVLALLLAACGSSSPPGDPDVGSVDLGGNEASCPISLSAVTPLTQNVQAGGSADLAVRLTNCRGEPPAPVPVSFTIKGDSQGSVLSSPTANSDGGGVARVAVNAGQKAASFQVEAGYQDATPVVFQVKVTTKPLGKILVELSYSGSKSFTEFQALLFANLPCATLDPFNLPTPALAQSVPVTSLADRPELANLAQASYTVVVVARKATELTGWGCTSPVSVAAGQTTTTTVVIQDIPILYQGTYLLDNQLDLTGALPPSVANTVKLFYEATDDHDLTNELNSHGNGQYGLDPGAFLLDFVYRQLCRWECKSGESFSNCSETNHPQGDISALYLQNFMSWGASKATFFGMCTALDFPLGTSGYVYTWLNQQVQNQIVSTVPTAAQNLLQIVGDISAAFTKMHIKSRLTISGLEVRSAASGKFEHLLETMVLTVHDLAGKPLVKEIKLADAGLTNLLYSGPVSTKDDLLQIPPHSFVFSFGKLLQYIYLNAILPALGYSSTGQMFQSWVSCASVGNWLEQQISAALGFSPFTAADYKSICDLGLQAAGNWVDSNIQSVVGTKAQIDLQGSCGAGTPLGPGRLALKLVNGAWTGTITEGTFTAPIKGSFTGQRQ